MSPCFPERLAQGWQGQHLFSQNRAPSSLNTNSHSSPTPQNLYSYVFEWGIASLTKRWKDPSLWSWRGCSSLWLTMRGGPGLSPPSYTQEETTESPLGSHRIETPSPCLVLRVSRPSSWPERGRHTRTRPVEPCLAWEERVWSLVWAGGPSLAEGDTSPVTGCPFKSGPGTSSQEPLCPWTQPFAGTAEVISRRGTAGDILALSGIFCSGETEQ